MKMIEEIKALGFRVWTRGNPRDTWCYFTDSTGTRIGYCEESRFGYNLSTRHIPNRDTGTGFRINENPIHTLTTALLEECFITWPSWARGARWPQPTAYRDFDHFNAKGEYHEV